MSVFGIKYAGWVLKKIIATCKKALTQLNFIHVPTFSLQNGLEQTMMCSFFRNWLISLFSLVS